VRNVSYIARGRVRTDVGGCGDLTRRDLDIGGSIDERWKDDEKSTSSEKVEWSFDCLKTSHTSK